MQKTVLYLGEISASQKKSWNKSIRVLNEQNQPVYKTLFALHDDDDICENIDVTAIRKYLPGYTSAQVSRLLKRLRKHGLLKKMAIGSNTIWPDWDEKRLSHLSNGAKCPLFLCGEER